MIEFFFLIQQGSVLQFKTSPQMDFNGFSLCWFWHVWEDASIVIPEHMIFMTLSCNLEQSSFKTVLVGTHRWVVHLSIWMSWCETGLGNFRLGSAAWIPAWQCLGCSSDISKSLDFLHHLRNLYVCFLLIRVLFLAAAAALCLLYSVSTYTELLWMLLCSNYAWLLLHTLPLLPTGVHLTKIYRDQLNYCALSKIKFKKPKLFVILKSTGILSTEKYGQNHNSYQIDKSSESR